MIFLGLFISTVLADSPVSKSKAKSIHELLKQTNAIGMGKQFTQQMFSMIQMQLPQDKQQCFKNATLVVELQMNDKKFAEMLIPVYAQHFTEQDINGLIKFYKTPLGKKLLEKQPLIMQDSMIVGQQWGQEMNTLLQKEMMKCK